MRLVSFSSIPLKAYALLDEGKAIQLQEESPLSHVPRLGLAQLGSANPHPVPKGQHRDMGSQQTRSSIYSRIARVLRRPRISDGEAQNPPSDVGSWDTNSSFSHILPLSVHWHETVSDSTASHPTSPRLHGGNLWEPPIPTGNRGTAGRGRWTSI